MRRYFLIACTAIALALMAIPVATALAGNMKPGKQAPQAEKEIPLFAQTLHQAYERFDGKELDSILPKRYDAKPRSAFANPNPTPTSAGTGDTCNGNTTCVSTHTCANSYSCGEGMPTCPGVETCDGSQTCGNHTCGNLHTCQASQGATCGPGATCGAANQPTCDYSCNPAQGFTCAATCQPTACNYGTCASSGTCWSRGGGCVNTWVQSTCNRTETCNGNMNECQYTYVQMDCPHGGPYGVAAGLGSIPSPANPFKLGGFALVLIGLLVGPRLRD